MKVLSSQAAYFSISVATFCEPPGHQETGCWARGIIGLIQRNFSCFLEVRNEKYILLYRNLWQRFVTLYPYLESFFGQLETRQVAMFVNSLNNWKHLMLGAGSSGSMTPFYSHSKSEQVECARRWRNTSKR